MLLKIFTNFFTMGKRKRVTKPTIRRTRRGFLSGTLDAISRYGPGTLSSLRPHALKLATAAIMSKLGSSSGSTSRRTNRITSNGKFLNKRRKFIREKSATTAQANSRKLVKINVTGNKFHKSGTGGFKVLLQGVGGIQSSGEGKQGYFVGPATLNYINLTLTSSSDPAAFDLLPWDLNPYQRTTGSSFFTGGANTGSTVATYRQDALYLSAVSGFFDVANGTTNGDMYVDIYWCLAKTTGANSPHTTWEQAMIDERFTASGANTGQSVTIQASQPGGAMTGGFAASPAIYGLNPTSYRRFNENWKVVKKEAFILPPGGNHRTSFVFFYNKKIEKDFIDAMPTNTIPIKGITLQPLVVFRGSIGVATRNPVVVKASAYAPVEIVHNSCYKYHWHPVKQDNRFGFTRIEPYFVNDADATARFRYIDGEDHLEEEIIATRAVAPVNETDE